MSSTQSIFASAHYLDYIKAKLESPQSGHGAKARFCRALKIQSPYLSKILSGKADLSIEQADAANIFLKHDPLESQMFMLKVLRARAGTDSLIKNLDQQIQKLLAKQFDLKEKFELKEVLSETDTQIYFSSTLYAQIHVLVGIPGFQTDQALSKAIGKSVTALAPYFQFLLSRGLIVQNSQPGEVKFATGQTRLHIGKSSPALTSYHTHWRLESIRSIQRGEPDAEKNQTPPLHYTSVMSVSKKDALLIREKLTQWIKSHESLVEGSKEEKAVVLTLSCFDLT